MFDYRDEYEAKYSERIFGKRRAVVANNKDPQKIGRIKVKNREIFGNSESAWASPCFPFFGGRDSGFFSVPPIGSCVWIEFEEGLVDHPIYVGGYFPLINDGHNSDGSPVETTEEFQSEPSSIPAHARGDYDGSDFGGLKGNLGVPESEYEAEYGSVTILQTPSGHMLEFDDTEGGERIQIHHSKGSHIEILQDGTVNIISEGNVFLRGDNLTERVEGYRESFIGASSTQTIEGDVSKTVNGGHTESVEGSYTINMGEASLISNSSSLYSSEGVLELSAGNLINVSSGGGINATSFDNVFLSSVGVFDIISLNSSTLPVSPMMSTSLNLLAQNGTARIVSEDQASLSVFGVEARGGLTGGQVYIGNLSEPNATASLGVTSIPFLKEPAVMGTQLTNYLTQLNFALSAFAQALGPTPIPTVVAASQVLNTAINILDLQVSSFNSNSVFVSQ